MTTKTKTMQVELKKVKIAKFLSEETTAFTADLWVDGKHIGYVKNDGHGGNNFIDRRIEKGFDTRVQIEAFEKWCEEQPSHMGTYGELPMNADFYISLMIEDYQVQQQIKRWCKTKTVIRLEGDKPDEFHMYKRPYDPQFAQRLRDTESKLVEIVNERYL